MYDELISALRNNADHYGYEGENGLVHLLTNAADAIEELNREKESLEKDVEIAAYVMARRWIPVTERLPESGVPTLICGDGNAVEQGFFDDEFGGWYDWGGNRTFVHHWMPLPAPPKEADP